MYLCHVVGIEPLTFASPHDATGRYGETRVVCEKVFQEGPAPFSKNASHIWFRVIRVILAA